MSAQLKPISLRCITTKRRSGSSSQVKCARLRIAENSQRHQRWSLCSWTKEFSRTPVLSKTISKRLSSSITIKTLQASWIVLQPQSNPSRWSWQVHLLSKRVPPRKKLNKTKRTQTCWGRGVTPWIWVQLSIVQASLQLKALVKTTTYIKNHQSSLHWTKSRRKKSRWVWPKSLMRSLQKPLLPKLVYLWRVIFCHWKQQAPSNNSSHSAANSWSQFKSNLNQRIY